MVERDDGLMRDRMERLGLQAELFTRDRPGFCRPLEGCKQIETMPGK